MIVTRSAKKSRPRMFPIPRILRSTKPERRPVVKVREKLIQSRQVEGKSARERNAHDGVVRVAV